MKLKYFTIEINGKCFDLPKNMTIPQMGSIFFIEYEAGIVDNIKYYVKNNKIYMVSIHTKPIKPII